MKSQIQCRRGAVVQIKISQGTEQMSCKSCFSTPAVWPLFEVYQLGSTHQGQSPKYEQVLCINITVAHSNQGKIIALVFTWLLGRYYLTGSYRFSVPSTTSQ